MRTVFTPQQVGVLVNPSCYLAKGTKRCQKAVITRRISDRVLQPEYRLQRWGSGGRLGYSGYAWDILHKAAAQAQGGVKVPFNVTHGSVFGASTSPYEMQLDDSDPQYSDSDEMQLDDYDPQDFDSDETARTLFGDSPYEMQLQDSDSEQSLTRLIPSAEMEEFWAMWQSIHQELYVAVATAATVKLSSICYRILTPV